MGNYQILRGTIFHGTALLSNSNPLHGTRHHYLQPKHKTVTPEKKPNIRNSPAWPDTKRKVHPRTGHEGPEGVRMYSSTLPSTSALDGGWVVNVTPRPPYPQERPGTHCTAGWVGPRAGLDGWGKSRPPPGFDPRTIQPVASRYTDWAIAAPTYLIGLRR